MSGRDLAWLVVPPVAVAAGTAFLLWGRNGTDLIVSMIAVICG
jgi:hypothetical protein